MRDTNLFVLTGKVAKYPELKYTAQGLPILTTVVDSERSVKRGNEWQSEHGEYTVTTFGKVGESISRYLAPGVEITIEGELRMEVYEYQGKERSTLKLISSNIRFSGGSTRAADEASAEDTF